MFKRDKYKVQTTTSSKDDRIFLEIYRMPLHSDYKIQVPFEIQNNDYIIKTQNCTVKQCNLIICHDLMDLVTI